MNILIRVILATVLIVPVAFLFNDPDLKTKINLIDHQVVFNKSETANTKETVKENFDAAKIVDFGLYDQLPLATVKLYRAETSSGSTAILIPQNHSYPGTSISDPLNDSAEVAQNQIYEILTYLNNKYDPGFVMNEGDVYGVDVENKVKRVSDLINLRSALISQIDSFSKKCELPKEEKEIVITRANKELDELDRAIALAGAAYRLAAADKTVNLVGAENQETYQECATLVQNYTYQKDQLANCQVGDSNGNLASNVGISDMSQLRRLAALINSLQTFNSSADDALSISNGDESMCTYEIEAFDRIYTKIDDALNPTGDSSGSSAYSRTDNPYAGITDTDKLENMINKSEDEIQAKIVDQRNVETVQNFQKALIDNDVDYGILQFGAGHEEGLIEIMNKQGIDVLVIKPDEVARREVADSQPLTSNLAAIKKLIQNN